MSEAGLSPLSPWLFNIILDMVVGQARTNFREARYMPSADPTVCR